jgi:SAM-dependent methyltransferase/DNA-directed RNA polymerase subunit RPC12/RpoP
MMYVLVAAVVAIMLNTLPMRKLLECLPAGARVLDLGARTGSFTINRQDLVVVRLDLEIPANHSAGLYVSADAALMPFRAEAFDAIISNHSLEHFVELEATLREIGRVIKRGGALYVAVPDATTLTDRIYRWLARGGGHVNAFRIPRDVIDPVEKLTGLPHRSIQTLYSSLSFLNRHNRTAPAPRRIALFFYGNEVYLAFLMWALRGIDRRLGTRLSVYGWEFYFGGGSAPGRDAAWRNVCVRCGSGFSEAFLRAKSAVRGMAYRCPECGGFNLLTRDSQRAQGDLT